MRFPKTSICIAVSGIACMVLSGCTSTAASSLKPAGSSLSLMQATDLHYLSPSFCDKGTMFMKTMANGDGKMTEYSGEILDALCEKVIAQHPDAFLLSGDLTFNGEKQSLQEVKNALENIEKEGIPVLVIPGNHDIDYPFAYTYEDDTVSPVENVSESDFKDIMKEFGYADGIARDAHSFSYVYPVSQDTWVMAVDANTEDNPGKVSDDTLSWMEEQLQKAQKQNITVVTMTHQNVLRQNQHMYQGFVIENNEEVSSLLKKYGVSLNLSGHSHLEHVAAEDGLTDACTESIALYPLQYASVHLDAAHEFTYANEKLGILETESFQRFDTLTRNKIDQQLNNPDLSAEKKEQMIDFAMRVNLKYFTGDTKDLSSLFEEEGWTLWKTYGASSSWIGYLESIKEAQ